MPLRRPRPTTETDHDRAGTTERASVVYDRSRELARVHGRFEPGLAAVDLLGVADGSQTTLEHALLFGRRRVEKVPGDVQARLGVHIIDAALDFLGARTAPGDLQRVRRRRLHRS